MSKGKTQASFAPLLSALFGPAVSVVEIGPPATDAPQGRGNPADNVTAATNRAAPGETWNVTDRVTGTRLSFDPADGTVVAVSADGKRKSVFDRSKYLAVLGAARKTVGWDGAIGTTEVLKLVRDFWAFFENNPKDNPFSPVKPPFASRVAAKKAAREVDGGACDACLQAVATLALRFGFDPDKPDDPVSKKCVEIAVQMIDNTGCAAEPQGDDGDDNADDDERDDDAE